MPDSIIDLWEKYNVTNGADIILVSKYRIFQGIRLVFFFSDEQAPSHSPVSANLRLRFEKI